MPEQAPEEPKPRHPLWHDETAPLPVVRRPTRKVYPRTRGIPIEKAHQVDESVQVALRLGAVLLAGGSPVEEVEAAVFAAASSLGLQNFEVDVTFNAIQLSVSPRRDRPGVADLRVVRAWWIHHARLVAAHQLVLELVDRRVPRDQVEGRIAEVERSRHPFPRWFAAVAGAVLAAAVVVRLDADLATALVTLLSATGIGLIGTALTGRRVPTFFVNALSAFLAMLVAIGVTQVDAEIKESLLVAGSIIMLLPGMPLMVATREAIGGFPITAAARAAEVTVATIGIVAGVSGGLRVAEGLGVDMSVSDALLAGGVPVWVATLAAAVGAAATAVTNQAPPRLLPAIAGVGGLGGLAFALGVRVADDPLAAFVAAVPIGFAGVLVGRAVRAPSVVATVPAVIPLLPGLGLYLGMLAMSQGYALGGIIQLLGAIWLTVGLATGVVLGDYVGGWTRRLTRR